MTHPLTPFAFHGQNAPYMAQGSQFKFDALVFPVKSKSGLGTGRRSGLIHRIEAAAAICVNHSLQYAARWLCAGRSCDAVLVSEPAPDDVICVRCETGGPSVYRCFDSAGHLLYIGSTRHYLRRLSLHKTQSAWWPEMASHSQEQFPTLAGARLAERKAIKAERPLYNKAGNGHTAA